MILLQEHTKGTRGVGTEVLGLGVKSGLRATGRLSRVYIHIYGLGLNLGLKGETVNEGLSIVRGYKGKPRGSRKHRASDGDEGEM